MGQKRKDLQHEQVLKVTNQNIYINSYDSIVSQMERTEKKTIKEVEEILGYKIEMDKYQEAYEYAKHKLEWQSKKYNTTYDARYLEIVIAEIYEQQAFKEFTKLLAGGIYA